MLKKLVLGIIAVLSISGQSRGDILFSENFGTLADGTPVTTSNTALTYVRSGTSSGSVLAMNPSSFGGASLNLGGSTSGSLAGVGLQTGLGDAGLSTFSFDIRTGASTVGTFFFATGSGNSFTMNADFANADLFYGFQAVNGVLQNRTSVNAWANTGITLATDTSYFIQIFANQTASTEAYGFGILASNTMDLVVNGVVVGNDLGLTNATRSLDAFRLYQINSALRVQLDNIVFQNTITAVPEPNSITLVIVTGCMGFIAAYRRRKAKSTKGSVGI